MTGSLTLESSSHARRSAQIIAFFALSLPVMLLGLVMAIDVGNIYLQRRAAQNAADAGALAGIRCIAKQWILADPTISNSATAAQKCTDTTAPNVWTEVARAVNCNQHSAPLTIELVEYVDVSGAALPSATVTGAQNGCAANGGTAPSGASPNATSSTSNASISGIRVTARADVTTFFLGAALSQFGISVGQAGAAGPGGTYPVRGTALAQIGAVSGPSAQFTIAPFAVCGRRALLFGGDPNNLADHRDLMNADGTLNTTAPWVNTTKFAIVGPQIGDCGIGSDFKGRVDDSQQGQQGTVGQSIDLDNGTTQSDINPDMVTLCGSNAVGTECYAALPLVGRVPPNPASCAGDPCQVIAVATFRVKYENNSGQQRVSAILVTNAPGVVAGGTVTGWTTFGNPNAGVTALKLSQ